MQKRFRVESHRLFDKQIRKLRKKKPQDAVKIDSYTISLARLGPNLTRTDKANHLHESGLYYLRPFPNRVIYYAYEDGTFVLLHLFEKKYSGAIRKSEIETAKNRLADWKYGRED